MSLELITLMFGLLLLLLGGKMLVSGASGIALTMGIPRVVVGMTAVAFGTSAPDLAVSLLGAVKGNPGITFGNVVGSNIANIGLLLGLTSIVRRLEVESVIITREIPMMLLSCGAVLALALDSWHSISPDIISRGDGFMLLLLFAVFLYYTTWDLRREMHKDSFVEEAKHEIFWKTFRKFGPLAALIVFGIAALVLGGHLLVDSAANIARTAGVPELVIGASLIAIGTSLPELVTCIYAAWKGMPDLVVGNIVGSNIFNTLLILGCTSAVTPVPVPQGAYIDLWGMSFLSCLLLVLSITEKRVITRAEGAGLVFAYSWYALWLAGR